MAACSAQPRATDSSWFMVVDKSWKDFSLCRSCHESVFSQPVMFCLSLFILTRVSSCWWFGGQGFFPHYPPQKLISSASVFRTYLVCSGFQRISQQEALCHSRKSPAILVDSEGWLPLGQAMPPYPKACRHVLGCVEVA